jgi:isoleucyl-tRNA synthetase
VEESKIDKTLEKEMDLAYLIVKLGRSARNSVNIKNRQPLSEMLISVKDLPEYYSDIVKDELNVKKVVLGADMKDYVSFEIKPNLPVLGREYGRLIPKIKEKIAEFNQMELATKVQSGKTEYIEIDEEQIELSSENLLVTMQGKEGFAFSGNGEIGVVIETEITPELKEEGYLREILSKVQNMRKDSGFEVMDNINLYVSGNEMLENVVKKFEDTIKHDTLAKNVLYNEPNKEYQDTPINGENLKIFVEVVK